MTPGREYGIGKYGRSTYDKQRVVPWGGIPEQPDAWIPTVEPSTVWAAEASTISEIWTPVVDIVQPWTPIV